MAATQKEMLAVAHEHDANQTDENLKISNAAKAAVSKVSTGKPQPIEDLKLDDENADPFNGNLNNRRVAARIAAGRNVTYGDPKKAAEDVAKSLAVNPEPEITTGDELPAIKLGKTPTPGSPAANKNVTQMPRAQAGSNSDAGMTQPAADVSKPVTDTAPTGAAPTGATGTDSAAPPQWK